jgi:hypothetical protein
LQGMVEDIGGNTEPTATAGPIRTTPIAFIV